MNLLLILTTVSQLVLVVLAQIPSSIDSEHGLAGIHLVMKTEEGGVVHLRPARGVVEEEAAVTPTTNGDTHRLRNNRKGNKSQDHLGGHKAGSKKPLAAENGSAPSPQSKHKQGHKNTDKPPRQGNKQQQQHGHQLHQGAGKRAGPKPKTQNNESTCRYAKSAWSNCDAKTNIRTRVLSLKKGEQNCLPTRTIQKKCKKGCRYEKGAWSQCSAGQMTREDKLQVEVAGGSDHNCDPVRTVKKKCKANGNAGPGKQHGPNRSTKDRKQKEKGARRVSSLD